MEKAYKGFDKDLKCGDFQYKIGEEYKEEKADLCNCGFYACENPMDVFGYYSPADSRYCEVEIDPTEEKDSDDSNRVSKTIKISAEIGLFGIIKAGVEYITSKVDWKDSAATNTGYRSASTNTGCQSASTNTGYYSASTNTGDHSASTNTGDQSAATNTGYRSAATNTGDYSASTNTGNYSAATNTGDYSASTNTGDHSASTNTGDQSAATNTGYRSAATNTGNYSAATNTGYYSASTNTGNYSAATNTGDYSASTNTGNYSAATVEGEESIAISIGRMGKAKGSLGCYIVLAERDESGHILCVKSHKIDGNTLKENTWYTLKSGKIVKSK